MVKKTTDTKIKRYRNPHGRCFHQNQTDLPLKLLYSEVSQVTQNKKKIVYYESIKRDPCVPR
jgi:hypothetical protein